MANERIANDSAKNLRFKKRIRTFGVLGAHFHARAPALGCRLECVQVLVATFFRHAHQPVAFRGREKRPPRAVNALQIGAGRIPGIKQNGSGVGDLDGPAECAGGVVRGQGVLNGPRAR